MTYREQIRTVQWKIKANEILVRDNYRCLICGIRPLNINDLHVHHLYYLPNHKAWEYDNECYVTVCKEHHDQLTFDLPKIAGLIAFNILKKKFDIL